ncbi:phosphatidylinositol 4-phosphate 5-kinase type-1 beta isoform X1, partial [Clarias magur]
MDNGAKREERSRDLVSFVRPDIIPSSTDLHAAVSTDTMGSAPSSDDLSKPTGDGAICRGDCGNSSSTLALDDAVRSDSSHSVESDPALDVYL